MKVVKTKTAKKKTVVAKKVEKSIEEPIEEKKEISGRLYEAVCLGRVGTKDLEKFLENIFSKEAKITGLGKKTLAYPIKKLIEAEYWQINFTADPKEILEMDKKLRVSEEIIRHLIIRSEI